MSNALALAGVSAVLQHYLHNLYGTVASNFPSPVHVSCIAPDQVQQQLQTAAAQAQNRVNLFMHLVTHNAAWRNVDFPSLSSDGASRVGNPPLGLDLHYLLTVYGSDPWQSEALLGFALMMFHQSPVLTRDDVEVALNARAGSNYPFPGYPLNNTLGLCGLNDQSEMLKITPESMSREEMAWLWTALKADYRLTFPFKVSVALMYPDLSPSLAFPVLTTSFTPPPEPPPPAVPIPAPQVVLPVAPPQLLTASYASGQPAAQPGDQIKLSGEFLSNANRVALIHTQLGITFWVTPDTVSGQEVQFTLPAIAPMPTAPPPPPLPALPLVYPAGSYVVAVQWWDATRSLVVQATNHLQLAVCHWLPAAQAPATAPSGSDLAVKLTQFAPPVWTGQRVQLVLSGTVASVVVSFTAEAQPVLSQTPQAAVNFLFPASLPTGQTYLARMVVDGISSQVQFNIPAVGPPSFTGPNVSI
jgi:Pvc16 N-terminal domain